MMRDALRRKTIPDHISVRTSNICEQEGHRKMPWRTHSGQYVPCLLEGPVKEYTVENNQSGLVA